MHGSMYRSADVARCSLQSLCHIPSAAPVAITIVSAVLVSVLFSGVLYDPGASTYLEKSVPFVGANAPQLGGADGEGILIAVIDTGVDYEHPDMYGWLGDGKVAGGFDYILGASGTPIDTDGHGTQVAGVAAADGTLRGVAPKSGILAYRVSADGSNVSSDLIAAAVIRAADDGADVINISMGVNRKNAVIEDAINKVLARGVVVVVAAGNEGPDRASIGSPGRSHGSLSVGATYNNLTSSLVATLDIADFYSYTVIPMVGSDSLESPVDARLVPVGYAKESDFEGVDVAGAIAVAQRGSDIEDDLLYFSLKEKHAADAGAAALIVYNNIDGMFLGELVHEFIEPGYEPRIPVVSMDREEGLEMLDLMGNGTVSEALLHLFHNPDFVAHFSSRGPVSPFYIKPDMVAPGAYINTTQTGSIYSIMSGTSFAAPHVSGAAALLLEKNPGLDRHEIKSILVTTADSVYDAYGNALSVHEAGSGRLNITRAYGAEIAILPSSLVVIASEQKRSVDAALEIRPAGLDPGVIRAGEIAVRFDGPDFLKFAHALDTIDGTVRLLVRIAVEPGLASDANNNNNGSNHNHTNATSADNSLLHEDAMYGEHEGRILVSHAGTNYVVPFLLHYTRASVNTTVHDHTSGAGDDTETHIEHEHSISFDVSHPDGWDFAKIDVIDSITEETVTVTATPGSGNAHTLGVKKDGVYWIDAKITSGGTSHDAYDVIHVGTAQNGSAIYGGGVSDALYTEWVEFGPGAGRSFSLYESLPLRQIALAVAALAVIGTVGAVFWMLHHRKAQKSENVDLL